MWFLESVEFHQKKRYPKVSSFHVDSRINLKLDYELAIRIGEVILRAGTEDKQILALGHKLANMDEENQESVAKWQGALRNEKFSGWAKSEEVPLKEKYGVSVKKITQEVAAVSVEKIMQEVAAPAAQDKIRARKIRWGIE